MTIENGSQNIFLGRQPIFNRNLELYGYELLFDTTDPVTTNSGAAVPARSQVVVNAFIELGLGDVVGDSYVFMKIPPECLLGERLLPLRSDHVVLELQEKDTVDEQLIRNVSQLTEQGFTIALDEFDYSEQWKPLLDLAGIIKVDVLSLSDEDRWNHAVRLRKFDARLLAQNVESEEEYEILRNMGYDYFQGGFLAKPKILRINRIPNNKLRILHILAELQSGRSDLETLEQIISRDVAMSRKILRYIDSIYSALGRKVNSIHEAIVLVGTKNIRRWSSLIAMSGINDRPGELLGMAMTRARMCELIAEKSEREDVDSYFNVGLFSVIEAVLRLPMANLVAELPFSEETKAALVDCHGQLGEVLQCVISCEKCACEGAGFGLLDSMQLRDIHIEAMAWSGENTRLLLR